MTELARVTAALKASQPQAQTAAARPARIEVPGPPAETVAREPVKEVVNEPEPPPVPAPAAPPPTPAVEVSASAIERLRSTIPRPDKAVPEPADTVPLSPNGQQAAHHVEPPTQLEPVPRSAGAAAVETREPKLDFLFRPRQARHGAAAAAGGLRFTLAEAACPRRAARSAARNGTRTRRERRAVCATRGPARAVPGAAPQERTVAILKSGVVDGMAYTLYADGSIEAQLPQGTVRFGSIAELRAHIENNA